MLSYTARNQLFFSMTPQAAPGAYDLNWHWYDASGLRVKTHVNSGTGWAPPSVPDGSTGSTTYYVYDGADVAITLLRFGSSWSVRQRFLSGGVDQPLAAWTSEGGGLNLAFVTDCQGSVRAAVKANGQRETNASYWSRNAFGGMNGAGAPGGVQTQTGFTGASTPNASGGFTYLRNRWYDPQTGRFLTQDPIGLAGGVNLYAYAGNNPITYSDPFGLCPEEDPDCPTTAEKLSALIRNGASAAASRLRSTLGAFGNALQRAAPRVGRDLAVDAAFAVAVPVVGEVRLGRRVAAVAEGVGTFLSESRHLRGITEARKDFSRIGATADDVVGAIARSSGWQSLEPGAIAGGRLNVGSGTIQYTLKQIEGTAETVVNAWIPGGR